ncbi:hypothetical protein BDR22DRAFT_868036 [Usnea florida]
MEKTSKPVSPHVGFYRSFGRPIAKVFLGAVVAYQTIYWVWVKLEVEEIKNKKRSTSSKVSITKYFAKQYLQGEISDLEAEVQSIRNRSSP